MNKLRDSARDQSCVRCHANDVKHCRRCGLSKPVDDFTRNEHSPDGRYSLCRECKKHAAKKYYATNRNRIVAHVTEYQRTPAGREKLRRNIKAYWQRHPQKRSAHDAVRNAKKAGLLKRSPCEVCGETRAHAHHDDYTKPLDVRWLCRTHHMEWHRGNPEVT